jgi:hypothetical protein
MKPRLRSFSFVQDEPPDGWDSDASAPFSEAFNFWMQLDLILDLPADVLWSLNVVSTSWIKASGLPFAQHSSVVLGTFDQGQLDRFIHETLAACAADTWRQVWINLASRLNLDETVSLELVLSELASDGGAFDD